MLIRNATGKLIKKAIDAIAHLVTNSGAMIADTITSAQSVSSHLAMLGKVSCIFSIGLLIKKPESSLEFLSFLIRSPRIKWRYNKEKAMNFAKDRNRKI